MADVFLSYARADQERAAAMAGALEVRGTSLWWDRRLAAGADYGLVIEREIEAARCVLVSWSKTARESLWVRAEANAALDAGKLVQLNLDAARLPLPFTMLHALDFSVWRGRIDEAPWPELIAQVDRQVGGAGELVAEGRRPDPGGVPVVVDAGPALQGFDRVALIGWAACAAALIVGIFIIMAARGALSASLLAAASLGALILAIGLAAIAAFLLARTRKASRR